MNLAINAEKAGIYSIIVDWEFKGKSIRQKGHNLEINRDTHEDVQRLSTYLKIPITVRINAVSKKTSSEVDCALTNGARILMLPMATSVEQVKEFLAVVDKRAITLVQIETSSLVEKLVELKQLDWDYAYIGLNDLMVASGKHSIWESILDGTAESICDTLQGRVYGFGGSTVLGGGEPIINVLILHELIRLGGSISVMRRTFKRELLDRDFNVEMKALREFTNCSEKRGEQAKKHDHEHLLRIIRKNINFEMHA